MTVEYLKKMPKWWNKREIYDLVLSNDIDSLFSCELLNQLKGWGIRYFYDFDSIFTTEDAQTNFIGVDVSLISGKCFDNHVVMLSPDDNFNENSINLNIADRINRENYFNKYCGSTLLTVWSLYNVPLPKTEEGKLILLAIDATFKGFYSVYDNDRQANKRYLVDVLNFGELYEVLQRHKQEDFIEVICKYRLADKIKFKDGYLQTNIDLEGLRKVFDLPFLLLESELHLKENYEVGTLDLRKDNKELPDDINSLALTKKDFAIYSKKINGGVLNDYNYY